MKTVSVIVPAYNVERYIAKCLDSLIAQTLHNMEIIVVNDSSTDDTQSIIDEYVKKYPKLIFSYIKPNGGIADVRNYALTKVHGEYFGFLDGDDYTSEDMFEKMYRKAKECASDIVSSNFIWKYPSKSYVGYDGPYGAGKEMLVKSMATLWSKIYRTEFIQELNISFPTGYRYEDVYFLYCLAPYAKQVNHINESFVHYIQRAGSITHVNDNRVKDMIHIFHEIVAFYKEASLFDAYEAELEYLYARFFLGNSLLRTLQIEDKTFREGLIDESFSFLNELFPSWRKNMYLHQEKGLKRLYYKIINRKILNLISPLLRLHMKRKQRGLYE